MVHLFSSRSAHTPHRSQEHGFSLLELLLVIGVLGIVILGVTRITQSWIDGETANNAGQHLARVTGYVQKFVDARGLELPSSSDVIASGQVAGSPWEDLYNSLDQEGLISADGALRSPSGVELIITYIADPATKTYRASIISLDNLPNRRALQIARHVGTTGGTVAAMASNPSAIDQATGAFGQWSIDVANLVPGGAAAFPCDRTTERGCLVSIVNYTEDELCGSYLYRHATACPDGNTMYTDLNMNNQTIQNAAHIDTADLYVSDLANLGNTTVSGPANFNGPTVVAGGLTVNSGMTVTGDANFANNVNMTGGGTLNVTHLNAHDIRTPSISTNNLDAQDMNVSGAVAVHDNVTVSGNVVVQSTDPSNPSGIYASTVNASTLNATGGQITTGMMNVQNTMTVTGGLQITGTTSPQRTLVTDRLVADDCVRINSIPETYGNPC